MNHSPANAEFLESEKRYSEALREERREAEAMGKARIPTKGSSPQRYYGPRVPGGEPWLQKEDGSWWKWNGVVWVGEECGLVPCECRDRILDSEARS